MTKTKLGFNQNFEGAFCYLLLWLSGIVLYLIEDDNKYIKFHAAQSIIIFLPLTVIGVLFGGMFGVGFFWGRQFIFLWYIGRVIWLIIFILWLLLMYKAFTGKKYKLPIVGEMAEEESKI